MPILRAARRERFVIIDRHTVQDIRLSLAALGLLTLMLSYPDSWVWHRRHLQQIAGCGRDQLQRLLGELEDAGYIERPQMRTAKGRWEWPVTVHEVTPIKGGGDAQSRDAVARDWTKNFMDRLKAEAAEAEARYSAEDAANAAPQ